MPNTGGNETFSVELVSICKNIELTQDTMLEEGDPILSHLFFFHIENKTDKPVTWFCQKNYFIGSDGFQYESDQNINREVSRPEILRRHWYAKPEIQPGQKTRCVAELPDPPADINIEKIIYQYEEDYYEIEVEHDQLQKPPLPQS
jgi:hypothetical protein